MTRKEMLLKGVAATGTLLLAGCTDQKCAGATIGNLFVHHVFFWLKEPNNQEHRAQLEAALKQLVTIDLIVASHIGVAAPTVERGVVDNTYSFSLLTIFADQAAQEAYQPHPDHQRFVTENSHLWERVVVYDSLAV